MGGVAEEPLCLLVLSKIVLDLGIEDCSSARKSRSNQSTFGPFAFG
jgi:hypothetical protein